MDTLSSLSTQRRLPPKTKKYPKHTSTQGQPTQEVSIKKPRQLFCNQHFYPPFFGKMHVWHLTTCNKRPRPTKTHICTKSMILHLRMTQKQFPSKTKIYTERYDQLCEHRGTKKRPKKVNQTNVKSCIYYRLLQIFYFCALRDPTRPRD